MPASLARESEIDVLVVGAGPAGLMCANGLAKAGVNIRIIDQRPAKVAAGQADGIQPRTLEVLQSYGLAERLLREGNHMHMAAFYNPSPKGGIVRTGRAPDITAPTARYPFEVTLHQGAIEAIFLDSLASMGVTVGRPIIPTSIELDQNPVTLKDPQSHPIKAVLKHLDAPEGQSDTEVVYAKYLVGADGAHSWVRKSFGITMDGEQTDYIWGVVDMVPDTDLPDIRNKCAIHSDNGSCMVIPREGDMIRLYIQLADADVLDPRTRRVDKARVTPQRLLDVAKKSFKPFRIETSGEIDWWTLYIIGQRVASKFSVHERVFIAGDACHTHSPKAGQGMNASMNDAHNLIWKLTQVLRGWADMSLLKTYEFERRKYAQDLIAFDKKFSALFSGKPRTDDNEDGVSHEEFVEAFQTFGAFTSGIGIHYPPSAIVDPTHQAAARNLVVGQRMLPHVFVRAADAHPVELHDLLPADARFKLLVFTGAPGAAQLARVRALAEDMARPGGALGAHARALDVVAVSAGTKDEVDYTDVPAVFRPHWSRVLVDDTDVVGRTGGGGYEAYGIGLAGALVVVRPDGYVGLVVPFEHHREVDRYFASFMRAP
ncbi:hypothetical protein OBBRIDRAFT_784167 [Obba rivulosa]|uniref:Phenol 2-monooxygenase n=1 Tax=Obba rivulosa TaxID=1052685 RepID=A0A8E2AKI5_9APHY|nr:hypothetical protein OBBRIDRAFT_784167 [Obba rivulosa]